MLIVQFVTPENLEQVAHRHATVPMQQAVLGTQESVTVRDVRQDGQETTVKVCTNDNGIWDMSSIRTCSNSNGIKQFNNEQDNQTNIFY